MSLSEEEIMRHLLDDIAGRPLSSFGEIDAVFNPYDYQPDLIHAALTSGSSGVSYHSINTKDRKTRNRCGHWQRVGIEDRFRDRDKSIYKQKYRFMSQQNGPTNWVMIEYTLYPNRSNKNMKAICAIQDEGSSRHNVDWFAI